jgi:hypothetical protein
MSLDFSLKGIINRFVKGANRDEQELRLTALGSLAVAQTEPPLVEVTRAANRFYGGLQLAANGIAPDTALPTTTAKLVLYNGESDGGRGYYVDHLHHFLISGTAAAGSTLWVCVSNGKIATPVAANVTGFNSQSASGSGATKAKWGTAATLPAGTVWFSVGGSFQLAAANVGQSDQPLNLRGGICIPPGYAMGLAVFSGAGTTPLYGHSAAWSELETDLES